MSTHKTIVYLMPNHFINSNVLQLFYKHVKPDSILRPTGLLSPHNKAQ